MTAMKARVVVTMAALLSASLGWAQTAPSGGISATGSAATTNARSTTAASFQSLSSGNQKIARALFEAQTTTTNGPIPLSLNQIASLRASEGWGSVFKQMQAQGLIQAKNLGQVVSDHEHALRASLRPPRPASAAGGSTGITTGSNRTTASAATQVGSHDGKGSLGSASDDGHGKSFGSADDVTAGSVTTAGGVSSPSATLAATHGDAGGGISRGGAGGHGR